MKLYLLMASVMLLSACSVRADMPNRVVIDSEGVTIDAKQNGNGNFCPPGQAKKGNC
ncbi:hypothetical protein OXI21_08595 [Ignatzschineria sp. RMDPL8A]|uniref:Lipoprotein n=1 Tax=Candidatus Ignatzschineria merdigallinarum TaxID=2838621 RepID=A0A9D1Q6W8_9GAMM|nr:hypothetical protein [Ignatzschineria sp. RMDPL8A]MDG9730469.1 hypothetical protein [Ignatzschineria sp. RMDPL8A]NLD09296.1 hypothetical protein [Xanthomonadaceae bacterium]HIW07687.1 hypothetical protein [Candidatus Ignatzschineria merdigallinarum]